MKKILLFIFVTMVTACDESGGQPGLVLYDFEPVSNARLDGSDTLNAGFVWDIDDPEFKPSGYFIRAQFKDISGHFTLPDSLYANWYAVKSDSGSGIYTYFLANIWSDPELKHPVSVRFELIKVNDELNIEVLERTKSIEYRE